MLNFKMFSLSIFVLFYTMSCFAIKDKSIVYAEQKPIGESITMFNFTEVTTVADWTEQADTVKDFGKSKAVLTLQKTKLFKRAIFFALINPQPNGAGFAGVRKLGIFNLRNYKSIQIKCRSQGQFHGYKIVLRHRGQNEEPSVTFEQYFQAPIDEFGIVTLPFSDFKSYYLGMRLNSTETLDKGQITSFGLQTYGGAHLLKKQRGPATLEIDWIQCAA